MRGREGGNRREGEEGEDGDDNEDKNEQGKDRDKKDNEDGINSDRHHDTDVDTDDTATLRPAALRPAISKTGPSLYMYMPASV